MTTHTNLARLPSNGSSLDQLSDAELLSSTRSLVGRSNQLLAALLAHLGEVEARGIHRTRACSSLYAYCIYELRLSEDEAFRRVAAARLVRRFPALFEAVAGGELHLTGLLMLGPHLTEQNLAGVLARAKHRTKKEIARLVRLLDPLPDVPPRIEPLGPAPARAESAEATAPQRYKVQFTATEEYVSLVERAKALLSHALPSAALEEVHLRAMRAYVAELEKQKYAVTAQPRRSSGSAPAKEAEQAGAGGESRNPRRRGRYVPAAVRRAVFQRDGGRCAYVDASGKRCSETRSLELHHLTAFAQGGEHTEQNLALRCAAHNALAAEEDFGRGFIEQKKDALEHEPFASHER